MTPDDCVRPFWPTEVRTELPEAGQVSAFLKGVAFSVPGPAEGRIPSPNGRGWKGNAAEVAFARAIGIAIGRKSQPTYWRKAPDAYFRCVLMRDQTNSGVFVDDAAAQLCIEAAVAAIVSATGVSLACMLVRGRGRILTAGVH